jgi:hypothetical protein
VAFTSSWLKYGHRNPLYPFGICYRIYLDDLAVGDGESQDRKGETL